MENKRKPLQSEDRGTGLLLWCFTDGKILRCPMIYQQDRLDENKLQVRWCVN